MGNETHSPMWPLRILGSVVGLIGFSSMLYALGFMVLRSHDAFYGLWGGIEYDAASIVEEGGRFLLYTFIKILELFSWRSLSNNSVFSMFTLIVTAVAMWLPDVIKKMTFTNRALAIQIYRTSLILLGIVLLILTWVLLETFGVLLAFRGILLNSVCDEDILVKILQQPLEYYGSLLRRFIVIAVLFVLIVRLANIRLFQPANLLNKLLLLMLVAETCLMPAAYGRLVYAPEYPVLKLKDSPEEERLLIRSSGSYFMLWNMAVNNIELVKIDMEPLIRFYNKRSLLSVFHEQQKKKETHGHVSDCM